MENRNVKYSTRNTFYFSMEDGSWHFQKRNKNTAHPLDHAAYIPESNYQKLIGKFEKLIEEKQVNRPNLEKLIDESKKEGFSENGGKVVSIIKKDEKLGIRNSGIVLDIKYPSGETIIS